MMEFCDRDTAVCLWKTGNNNIPKIIVVSVYMNILLPGVWPAVFERLLDYCERKKKEVLICGDTNSWSTLWGSREMNKRGENSEDLIFTKNLTILNEGSQPTFITCRATSTINVTMAIRETANTIREWRVHPDDFSSDHQLIEFGITISVKTPTYSQNWKLGDFSIFRKSLDKMMTAPLKSWTARILEGEVEQFHASIKKALNISHPVKPCRTSLRKAAWWNKEAGKLRWEVKVYLSRFRKNCSEENFSLLIAARRGFFMQADEEIKAKGMG